MSSRTQVATLAFAVMATVLATFALARQRPGGDDTLAARVAALEAGLAAERARNDGRTTHSLVAPAPAVDRVARELAPPTPQQRQWQATNDALRHRLRLEAAFEASARAPANDPAPAAVRAAFAHPGVLDAVAVPVTQDVACRASLCVVRARFGPHEDDTDWTNRMLLELAAALPNASSTTVPLPDGTREVRLYASRPGQPDPLDQAAASGR